MTGRDETRDHRTPSGRQQARADAQRGRILDAAQACFIERGFHAASMNEIAREAGMSAGLIYRYFENKNAVILAIIERQNTEIRSDIASLRSACDFVARIVELFGRWQRHDPGVMNPVLFLEMTAASRRDAQIASALDAAQRTRREDVEAWIRQEACQAGQRLSGDEVRTRALALQCLIEGLMIRAVRDPALEHEVLMRSLGKVLPHILPFPRD